MPLATGEAKRKNTDVPGHLQQAKRYSRGFTPSPETLLPDQNFGATGEYRVPFAFSTNGRPYLRQLATKSGIWFCDLRWPENLSRALDGWYSPEGLTALLKQDAETAHAQLVAAAFAYGFWLRHYQQAAILAVECAIAQGQRAMLLAMATGTGKTKTGVALIYRLLKARRFRRVLFLVDRSALGEQAANAFKDTRMENLQTFADIFGIQELDVAQPDTDTMVHIATVQGMVQRVLAAGEDRPPPPWTPMTASWWTSATAATCWTGSCPTPSSGFAATRTTSPSTVGYWTGSMPLRSGSPPPQPCTPPRSSARPSTFTATARR
jgi:type I restriction enzyme R subunit